jgi:uncharacterized protein (TIGR03083 family)
VPLDHVAAIRSETARLAGVVAGADQDVPVAACPEWAVRDLAAHVGEVQRFWAWVLRRGSTEWPARGEEPQEKPGADLVAWLTGGADQLVSAIQDLDPQAPTWAWWPGPHTAGQVARHQVHEAALHRWDAEQTGGAEPQPFPAEQAADGIDELLHVTLAAETRPWEGSAGVLVIDPDDADQAWTVDCTGPRPLVRDLAAAAADCRLLGPASDVQLLLWGRPRQFRFRGDATLLTDFIAWPDFE